MDGGEPRLVAHMWLQPSGSTRPPAQHPHRLPRWRRDRGGRGDIAAAASEGGTGRERTPARHWERRRTDVEVSDPAELDDALALWQDATVEVARQPSLLRARWEKLCWNVPFNGLTVAAGGIDTEAIVTDPALRAEARALMEEVVAAGNAELAAAGSSDRIDGEAVIARMFALTDAMGPYRPSTLIDYLDGRAIEVDAIFAEPAGHARALGVPTPRMDMLAALLARLDPGRGQV